MSNDPRQPSTVDKAKVREVAPGDKDEQKQADAEDRVAERERAVDDLRDKPTVNSRQKIKQ